MKTKDAPRASKRLAAVNSAAMAEYQKMRALVMPPPGVEPATAETVLAMQFAVLEYEFPFKIHAMLAMKQKVSREQLQGLLLAGVGATLLSAQAGQALGWLDEACEELRPTTT